MSKAHPIPGEAIPPHMLTDVNLSAAQKKMFAKAKRRAARAEAKPERSDAKRSEKK